MVAEHEEVDAAHHLVVHEPFHHARREAVAIDAEGFRKRQVLALLVSDRRSVARKRRLRARVVHEGGIELPPDHIHARHVHRAVAVEEAPVAVARSGLGDVLAVPRSLLYVPHRHIYRRLARRQLHMAVDVGAHLHRLVRESIPGHIHLLEQLPVRLGAVLQEHVNGLRQPGGRHYAFGLGASRISVELRPLRASRRVGPGFGKPLPACRGVISPGKGDGFITHPSSCWDRVGGYRRASLARIVEHPVAAGGQHTIRAFCQFI